MRQLLLIFIIIFIYGIAESAFSVEKIANTNNWKKVVLVYFHDIPYQKYLNLQYPSGCFFTFAFKPAFKYVIKPVWRCKEYISLLRPVSVINKWKQKQKNNFFFDFTLLKSGIYHIAAHIESVSPIEVNMKKINSYSENTGIVTGIFLHHSADVKTYTFKSSINGRLSKVNATPDHPFYVENIHAWMPLNKITSAMVLIDNHKHPISLQCPDDRQDHCGAFSHSGKINKVYNIEVYKKHTYYVGKQLLFVHNCGNANDAVSDQFRNGVKDKVKNEHQLTMEEHFTTLLHGLYEKDNHIYPGDAPQALELLHSDVQELTAKYNTAMETYHPSFYKLSVTGGQSPYYTQTYSIYNSTLEFNFLNPEHTGSDLHLSMNYTLRYSSGMRYNHTGEATQASRLGHEPCIPTSRLCIEGDIDKYLSDFKQIIQFVTPVSL